MMKKLDLKSSHKKIESPLAKYNSTGQLFCVLCNSPVKSEIFWTGHVNGRSHQDALNSLKSKKRPQVGDDDGPSPKKKALTTTTTTGFSRIKDVDSDQNSFKVPFPVASPVSSSTTTVAAAAQSSGRSPTFVAPPDVTNVDMRDDEDDDDEDSQNKETEKNENVNGINLPEGFFDDPKEDAKIRGKEWRDPEELEWERFTREIANEELKSSTLRVQDEEDSTKTRELEEIEEQMAHWQKVIDLERKAEEAKKLNKVKETSAMTIEDDEDLDEYDEEMDWRSKRH